MTRIAMARRTGGAGAATPSPADPAVTAGSRDLGPAPGPWDVAVVGAGPAGSRCAELLAHRGVGVLLLDPKAPWEKPCGGGLTAAALAHTPELHELDR